MVGPLLETKLHAPRRRSGLVSRARLRERLDLGARAAITVLSAAAGFGKTTLLTEWLAAVPADGPSTAWVSLDARDSDPAVFWRHVAAALCRASPPVGTSARALLDEPTAPTDVVLATLINDLDASSDDIVLVLDDYHVIDGHDVPDGMAFLVEHLPAQLHLVISGRADPALPLARLRARGELVEIRAADLRFTPEEGRSYFNETMGLALTADDVAALDARTEGWIAAMQLAALSLLGRDDVADFIAGFAGDDGYIVDYLTEEVLSRQPDALRRFLLQTSVLERLSAPLCNAITGREDGKAMLLTLERGNLFLRGLDDRRQWYRYHQLFADVLQAHLLDEHADEVPALHLRASTWFNDNGEPADAIRHALAAGDLARAADLVELAIPTVRRDRQDATLRGWVDVFPDELLRARPVLAVGLVGALAACGELESIEPRLRHAERWLSMPESAAVEAGMVVVDPQGLQRLPGSIALYRAAVEQARGNSPEAMRQARRVLDVAPPDDLLTRAAAAGVLGLASWANGALGDAARAYHDCQEGLDRAGHLVDVLGCAIARADIRLAQGRLGDARRTYEHALARAGDRGGPVVRGTADMHVGLADLHREHDDLEAAAQHLHRSQELGAHAALPQNRYRWHLAMAHLREAQGDVAAAFDLLDEAERLYTSDFFPEVRPVPAVRARMLSAHGRLPEAHAWARERRLSVDDDLTYLREYEHITLARILLASASTAGGQEALDDADRLLQRLLMAAERGERQRSAIEVLLLQALVAHARSDDRGALDALERAVALAEPEGYVRTFVEAGADLAKLLASAGRHGVATGYVRHLLAAFDGRRRRTPPAQPLVDPLSDRELEVLRLLMTDLNGPEIASELVVSLNTLRTHTRHIYAKLGANSRREAVRRARELRLQSTAHDPPMPRQVGA